MNNEGPVIHINPSDDRVLGKNSKGDDVFISKCEKVQYIKGRAGEVYLHLENLKFDEAPEASVTNE